MGWPSNLIVGLVQLSSSPLLFLALLIAKWIRTSNCLALGPQGSDYKSSVSYKLYAH